MDQFDFVDEPAQAGSADMAREIVRQLEERGVPAGAWLVDIGRVRRSLRDADVLMRRLEDAIIRACEPSALDEL